MPWRPCPKVADCECASPRGMKRMGEDDPEYASLWPTPGPASQSTVAPTFSSRSTQLRGTLERGSGSGFRKESSANTTARSRCAPPLAPNAAEESPWLPRQTRSENVRCAGGSTTGTELAHALLAV